MGYSGFYYSFNPEDGNLDEGKFYFAWEIVLMGMIVSALIFSKQKKSFEAEFSGLLIFGGSLLTLLFWGVKGFYYQDSLPLEIKNALLLIGMKGAGISTSVLFAGLFGLFVDSISEIKKRFFLVLGKC